MTKTGLSRRVISQAVAKLLKQGLISINDHLGNPLNSGTERAGRSHLFYSSTCALSDINLCTFAQKPVQKVIHNKTNYTKLNKTKLREKEMKSVGEIIANMTTSYNGRLLIKNYLCRDMIE